ncbi:LysR family transcriptional regulator [Streptomyces bacillaris]|uniref:LysR family transcriptional regulator n=1 Tax=Streptomyces bacillaris TaxID=68179 RepID=UPI003D9F9DCA
MPKTSSPTANPSASGATSSPPAPRRAVVTAHQPFGRVAADLHVAQPALSRQIQRLEKHLGTRLLDRRTRGTRLTSAGRTFLPLAHDLLEAARQAEPAVREQARSGRHPGRPQREPAAPGQRRSAAAIPPCLHGLATVLQPRELHSSVDMWAQRAHCRPPVLAGREGSRYLAPEVPAE